MEIDVLEMQWRVYFEFFIGVSSTCGRFVRGFVPAGWVAGGGFFGVTCCDQGRAIVLGARTV